MIGTGFFGRKRTLNRKLPKALILMLPMVMALESMVAAGSTSFARFGLISTPTTPSDNS